MAWLVYLLAMPMIFDEERELRARLRVLESITPRIRAAECGVCAVIRWRADDLGAGRAEIVRMERAG